MIIAISYTGPQICIVNKHIPIYAPYIVRLKLLHFFKPLHFIPIRM